MTRVSRVPYVHSLQTQNWCFGLRNDWQCCLCLVDRSRTKAPSVYQQKHEASAEKTKRGVHGLIVHVSSPFKHSDLLLVRQQQSDIVFVIPIVYPRVSERSGQMVLLPVVVPVPILVCAEAKHADLQQMENMETTMSQVPTSKKYS